jgi:tetratricopeptide (TPR) repeat protein
LKGGSYYHELAEVHKRYGVYDKAIEALKTAIEKESEPANKARFYESLTEVYQMSGQPKEAAEQIKNALASAQTVEEKCRYNIILGQLSEQAGDIGDAKKSYEFVVANATRDADKRSAQLSLYRLQQKLGELDKVIADLEKKIQDNPTDEQALDNLAQIFNWVAREPSRSLPVYERLAKLRPKDMTILNRLVYLYQSDKEYEKAAEVYQRIIDASPSQNKSYYYQHISRMYMLAGNKDEAVKWAEKSLSEKGTGPYTYISVAQIYLQNGLPEKALELYDRGMAACPRPVEKHRSALRFADLLVRYNMEAKAEELYKFVLKEAESPPLKSEARSKLIELYRKQGKTSEVQALEAEQKPAPAPAPSK